MIPCPCGVGGEHGPLVRPRALDATKGWQPCGTASRSSPDWPSDTSFGTRAGRERYEQLDKSAQQISQNPAVRNATESAAQTGREFAGKAYHSVSGMVGDKVGDKVPDSVAQRVRSLRERSQNGQDDWGTNRSNT